MPIIILPNIKKLVEKLMESKPIGHYHTPEYLKDAPIGPSQGGSISAPVNTTPAAGTSPVESSFKSIAPTPIPFKKENAVPKEVPVIPTCSLCSGLIKDRECMTCGGKQCPGCGAVNYATTINCSNCGFVL